MEEFTIIYRILRELRAAMDCEEEDPNRLNPERLKTTLEKRNSLLLLLEKDGYISGVHSIAYIGDAAPIVTIPPMPRITLKGLEYLQENTMMQKAARALKGIRDFLP